MIYDIQFWPAQRVSHKQYLIDRTLIYFQNSEFLRTHIYMHPVLYVHMQFLTMEESRVLDGYY